MPSTLPTTKIFSTDHHIHPVKQTVTLFRKLNLIPRNEDYDDAYHRVYPMTPRLIEGWLRALLPEIREEKYTARTVKWYKDHNKRWHEANNWGAQWKQAWADPNVSELWDEAWGLELSRQEDVRVIKRAAKEEDDDYEEEPRKKKRRLKRRGDVARRWNDYEDSSTPDIKPEPGGSLASSKVPIKLRIGPSANSYSQRPGHQELGSSASHWVRKGKNVAPYAQLTDSDDDEDEFDGTSERPHQEDTAQADYGRSERTTDASSDEPSDGVYLEMTRWLESARVALRSYSETSSSTVHSSITVNSHTPTPILSAGGHSSPGGRGAMILASSFASTCAQQPPTPAHATGAYPTPADLPLVPVRAAEFFSSPGPYPLGDCGRQTMPMYEQGLIRSPAAGGEGGFPGASFGRVAGLSLHEQGPSPVARMIACPHPGCQHAVTIADVLQVHMLRHSGR
ncbi:hypothetical protein HK104_001729 [Borealophlyctis nickersoniae]|nr:hypothetical protein HK104_001729 [Borealophlyctis nickersoniae]